MEMNRIEELLATTKLNDMMHKKDDDQKTTVLWILAIIGAVAAVAAIAYAVYCFFTPDYLEDFEEDFETMISTMISSVMKMKYSNIKKAAKAGIVKDSCLSM